MKRKTTSQIYDQEKRISKLSFLNITNKINQADPNTGGNLMLTNNWGNEKAVLLLKSYQDKQSKLYNLFQKYYRNAFKNEYPNHLANK